MTFFSGRLASCILHQRDRNGFCLAAAAVAVFSCRLLDCFTSRFPEFCAQILAFIDTGLFVARIIASVV